MKKSLLTALMLCALPLAYAEDLHYNVVEFYESANIRVPNDTMNVVLRITETGKSRQEVNNIVSRRVNAVLARAKANKQFEVESGDRHTSPEYDENRRIVRWTDRATIRVSSQDMEALSKLAADSQKESMIDHVSFSVSPQKYEAAVEKVSEKALQSFTKRAKHISESLGFKQYKIVKMDLNQSFEHNHESAVMMMSAAPMGRAAKMADVMDTSPGMQEISQTIHGSVQMY